MVYWKALILGVVEGLTEFIPVSSTGHLIIAGELVNYPEDHRVTFEIFIQVGAILAVFWHYRRHLWDLAARAPHDHDARNLILKVGVAFLPAAVVGLLAHRYIEEYLFSIPTVAGALIAGGLVILAVERRPRPVAVTTLERMTWKDALWVGIAQIVSMFPGVSRSGATIIGGLLTGLSRPVATQFSFYLALPTITAASLYSLWKGWGDLDASHVLPLAIGFTAAFFSALAVIRAFLAYVRTHDFRPFGYYRIIAGTCLLLWYQYA